MAKLISVGPIISSPEAREAELDVSLLERLSQRPLYQGLSPHITHLVQVSSQIF